MEGSWGAHGEGAGSGVLGGQPPNQHCTRRTRAEQDPAGEWGAFSKERSTGASFLTPHSLCPALCPPFFLGRLIHRLKCDFFCVRVSYMKLHSFSSHPLIPLTYSRLELNRAMPLCFSIILSTSKSLMRGW